MKKLLIAGVLAGLVLLAGLTTACVSQNSFAALVTVLGNATSSIAAVEGNTPLAIQIKADTSAASAAVLAWKSGTPATEAIEALNIVEDDLNLIPATGPYVALIDLGIGTVEGILQLLPQPVTKSARKSAVHRRSVAPVKLAKLSRNPAADFKAQWNKIAATDAQLQLVAIK